MYDQLRIKYSNLNIENWNRIKFDSNQPYSEKILYFNSIFYKLERIPFSKHSYQNKHNIIYDR